MELAYLYCMWDLWIVQYSSTEGGNPASHLNLQAGKIMFNIFIDNVN